MLLFFTFVISTTYSTHVLTGLQLLDVYNIILVQWVITPTPWIPLGPNCSCLKLIVIVSPIFGQCFDQNLGLLKPNGAGKITVPSSELRTKLYNTEHDGIDHRRRYV